MNLQRLLLLCATLSISLQTALGCLAGDDPNRGQAKKANSNPDTGANNNNNGAPNPLRSKMGIDGSDTTPYDESGFLNNENMINNGDDLSCDFEGQCCWGNDQPPNDQLEWRTASKQPDPQVFQTHFNAPPPQTTYLVTAAAESDPYVSGRFVSCTVGCADQQVTVKYKYWKTKEVELRVCKQDAFGDDGGEGTLLFDCENAADGGPAGETVSVSLPPGEEFDIVFVASNFLEAGGGVAMLDDIQIEFEPCGGGDNNEEEEQREEEEEEPAEEEVAEELQACNKLECSDPPCGYLDPASDSGSPLFGSVDKGFQTHQGRFENRITGVPQGKDGSSDNYMAVYLLPGEKAGLDSGELNVKEDGVFRFDHYESVFNFGSKVCLDDPNGANCPWTSNQEASPEDRKWHPINVPIPAGTKRLFLTVENSGRNQGALGLDNFRWLKSPRSGNPDDASEPGTC